MDVLMPAPHPIEFRQRAVELAHTILTDLATKHSHITQI
jgi:hypothetical protein